MNVKEFRDALTTVRRLVPDAIRATLAGQTLEACAGPRACLTLSAGTDKPVGLHIQGALRGLRGLDPGAPVSLNGALAVNGRTVEEWCDPPRLSPVKIPAGKSVQTIRFDCKALHAAWRVIGPACDQENGGYALGGPAIECSDGQRYLIGCDGRRMHVVDLGPGRANLACTPLPRDLVRLLPKSGPLQIQADKYAVKVSAPGVEYVGPSLGR